MAADIVVGHAAVKTAADNLVLVHHHGAHRHFIVGQSLFRFSQCLAHPVLHLRWRVEHGHRRMLLDAVAPILFFFGI